MANFSIIFATRENLTKKKPELFSNRLSVEWTVVIDRRQGLMFCDSEKVIFFRISNYKIS